MMLILEDIATFLKGESLYYIKGKRIDRTKREGGTKGMAIRYNKKLVIIMIMLILFSCTKLWSEAKYG